jgi:hypothetical protein
MGIPTDPGIGRAGSPACGRPRDLIGMLHDLYAEFPDESHAVLARTLLQAQRNVPPSGDKGFIEREVVRLLGLGKTRVHRSRS